MALDVGISIATEGLLGSGVDLATNGVVATGGETQVYRRLTVNVDARAQQVAVQWAFEQTILAVAVAPARQTSTLTLSPKLVTPVSVDSTKVTILVDVMLVREL